MPVRSIFALAIITLVAAPAATLAGERDGVVQTVQQLESRPIMDVLQARHISGEERTTAFLYEDRIEYYDHQLLNDIAEVVDLPATAVNGVLFTEHFLTQFRNHPGLYVVQRGWDQDGNCHVLTSRLRVESSLLRKDAAPSEILSLEVGNSCSGDPCRKCKPYDPLVGCLCEIGEKCNHTVTTED